MWPWLSAAQRLLARGPVQLTPRIVPVRTRWTVTEHAGTRWWSSVAVKTRRRDQRLAIEPVRRSDTEYDNPAPKFQRVYTRPPSPHAYGPRGPRTDVPPEPKPKSAQAKSKSKQKSKQPQSGHASKRRLNRSHPPHRRWTIPVKPEQPSKAELYYDLSQFVHLVPHTDTNPPASRLLRAFLDADHARAHPERRYNAHAIIALYHAAKSHRGAEFQKMTSRHYSLLIALFGALSVLTSAYTATVLPPSIHRLPVAPTSALVQMVPKAYKSEHWKFISLVVKDKQAEDHALGYIDHYWLMREALADAQRVPVPVPDTQRLPSPDEHLWRARAHYARIQHAAKHPLAHTDFLAALIASGQPEHVDYALGCLQHILRDSGGLDVALQSVLWQLILAQSAAVSEPARGDFLAELRRVVARTKTAAVDPRARRAPRTVVNKKGDVFCDVAPPTVFDAYDALAGTLFSPTQPQPQAQVQVQMQVDPGGDGDAFSLADWARREAASAFARSDDEAWQFLALLAAASPAAAEVGGETPMPALGMGADVLRTQRWVLVGALAALLRGEPDTGARELVEACWRLWRSTLESAQAPREIERALLLALVRLAGLTAHVELVEEMLGALCEPALRALLLAQEDFVRTGAFGDTGRAGAALELGAACVLCSGRRTRVDWPAVQAAVKAARLVDSRGGWRNYANQLLRHVLRVRAHRAADLLRAIRASRKQVKLADQVLVELVQGLADAELALAVQLHAERVRQGELPRSKEAAMLVALTRGVFRHRLARVHPDVARSLLAAFERAEYRPLPSTREHAHLRWTLCTAARSGVHAEAVALLGARLRQGDGDEFSTRFLMALAGSLLAQRQFRLAAALLRAVPRSHPAAAPLSTLVLARSSRASARRVAAAVPGLRCAALRRVLALARWSERHPDPRGALALRRLVARGENTGRQLRTAVQLLVRAGRPRAARRVFRVAATSPGAADRQTVTAMGNALLGARLRPRRKRRLFRQIRGVLARLDALAADSRGAFAADRVTLNVLLKAVVHWDLAVGPAQLRFLFNTLVARGYPGTPLDDGDVAPFELGRVEGVLRDVQRQPLHFVRHVRPLYKLLIIAFRARRDREAVQHLLTVLAAAREDWAARERERLVKSAVTRRRLWHARRRAIQQNPLLL